MNHLQGPWPSRPLAIIHIEPFSDGEVYTVNLGPYNNGQALESMVRPKSGSTVGVWCQPIL